MIPMLVRAFTVRTHVPEDCSSLTKHLRRDLLNGCLLQPRAPQRSRRNYYILVGFTPFSGNRQTLLAILPVVLSRQFRESLLLSSPILASYDSTSLCPRVRESSLSELRRVLTIVLSSSQSLRCPFPILQFRTKLNLASVPLVSGPYQALICRSVASFTRFALCLEPVGCRLGLSKRRDTQL